MPVAVKLGRHDLRAVLLVDQVPYQQPGIDGDEHHQHQLENQAALAYFHLSPLARRSAAQASARYTATHASSRQRRSSSGLGERRTWQAFRVFTSVTWLLSTRMACCKFSKRQAVFSSVRWPDQLKCGSP